MGINLVNLGNGNFFLNWKYGKKDDYREIEDQLQLTITVGTRIIVISGISFKNLTEFLDEMKNHIEQFKKEIAPQDSRQEVYGNEGV